MTRKSYAKVNIFLKIVGLRGQYHELLSRFVRVHSLYDLVSFKKGDYSEFTLKGNFGCDIKSNTIYKAYLKLKQISKEVEIFFKSYCVEVDKKIPEFAGLGGGSSNCATFINMVNEACSLNLTKDELAKIGESIGADVPFFIYEYDSANVSGIGEIVEKFDEDILDIQIITPEILCDTGKIFKVYRQKFYKDIDPSKESDILKLNSKEVLKKMTLEEANDLYEPALYNYPQLSKYNKNNWYFSGSGSSFFRVK